MKDHISRRDFLRVSAGLAAGAALSACTVAPAPTSSTAAATPASGAAAAPSQETVTIRFWNVWGAAREDLMNQIIKHFEDENPGIQVKNLVQPFENLDQNLFAAIASNDPPEVLMVARSNMLQLADEGLIIPIDDYVTKANLDLTRFYPSEIGNMRWQGKLYSMPMPTGGGITNVELINLDMFSKAGKPPVIPQTWGELETVAKEFTKTDNRGIVQVGADVGTDVNGFFAWLYCNNGKIYNQDLTKTAFDSPEGIATLEWMVNFTNNINGGVQNVSDFFAAPGEATQAQPWYNNTQLINFPNVSIFFHMQTYAPDMKWDMGVRPYNSGNQDAKSQGLSGEEFAWSYLIPKAVPDAKREGAFKWVQKITYDDNGACWFMQQQGRPSPLKKCNDDPSYYKANVHWDKVLKALEVDVSVDIIPPHTRIRDFVNQGVQAAMFGKASPADALAQAAKQAQPVIDEYWSKHKA